jgi:hypothetical protein
MSDEPEKNQHSNAEGIARENIACTRRELIEKLELLLQKGFEQAYQIDKSLLTLSAGALLLSVTFVGTLSEAKHCVGLLFVAWGCFILSIMAVIFAMQKAHSRSHADAVETAGNLERFSQMALGEAAIQRATFSVETHKPVAWLNGIAIFGFVCGVVFLCWFVGINLLADQAPVPRGR